MLTPHRTRERSSLLELRVHNNTIARYRCTIRTVMIPWTTIIVLFGRHLSLHYRCVGINREGEQGRKDELKSEQIQTARRDSQDYIII